MPRRDWLVRIEDILEACSRIVEYVGDSSEEEFKEDSRSVDAVIRNLTVIGEAAGHIPEAVTKRYPGTPWVEMRGVRNIVVHEYFGVSVPIIWKTVQDDIPSLVPLLQGILKDNRITHLVVKGRGQGGRREWSPERAFMTSPSFRRYIGIDYSGAETPDSSLKGLRVYEASRDSLPVEVEPPPSPRKYWTRRGMAEWLAERLAEDVPTIVGIDHGFSFPLRYFEVHHLEPDWPTFLNDFQQHWPTDAEHTYVDFVRDGSRGDGEARTGSARWRRITEKRAGAKSVFHFDVPGSVAKSTHAGLPWLRYLRQQLGERVHFWPFEGWEIPAGKSALVEGYPSLWRKSYPREGRTPDQHDAYVSAAWLRQVDTDGKLGKFLKPAMLPGEYHVARVEGWILGVM